MRVEILDKNEKVVSSFQITKKLTTLGQSPSADIQLVGKGIAPIHIAIENEKTPIVMDLGGPTPISFDGKAALEKSLDKPLTIVNIGDRKIQLRRTKKVFKDLHKQKWEPVSDENNSVELIRVRLYKNGVPQDVQNAKGEFFLAAQYGLPQDFKLIWSEKGKLKAQLPSEWIAFGGRIQSGKDSILKLEDWSSPTSIEKNQIYKIIAGVYTLEVFVTDGTSVVGLPRFAGIPRELRKPLVVSATTVLALFSLWFVLFGRPEAKVEEPYEVYARIKNIPVERIPDPEPNSTANPGGGGGSISKQTTAPTKGKPKQSAASKLAQSLTGGLKNLIGNAVSKTKPNPNAIVSQTGVSAIAIKSGGTGPAKTGKLSSIGSKNNSGVQGAAKLGKLAMKGSGKGFKGGSGAGLGRGAGFGIGNGVGNGIGRGKYKLIEEESIVEGGLDKEVIEAVIRNNLSQIKYCYERQLVANPDLFGKVIVNWSINAAGKVNNAAIKRTTLGSNAAEQCMVSKISRWTFPQPKNGVRVVVSYPFLF